MGALTAALERELAGEVRDDAYTRHLFAADASLFAIEPLAVAFPRDADDVAAAMSICARLSVPVVPRGGGTSLAGQAAGGRGLVLDCSRHMNRIEPIARSEEHTSELQSHVNIVCRLLLEKKKS